MSNSAIISTSRCYQDGMGVYSLWHGGLESILAFFRIARDRGLPDPIELPNLGIAGLVSLLHSVFRFDSQYELDIRPLAELQNRDCDNGVYVVGADWTLVDRWGRGSQPYKSILDLTRYERWKYNEIYNYFSAHEKTSCAYDGVEL